MSGGPVFHGDVVIGIVKGGSKGGQINAYQPLRSAINQLDAKGYACLKSPDGDQAAMKQEVEETLPEDLCAELSMRSIKVNTNGYHGILGPSGIELSRDSNGSFQFSTNIVFSKATDDQFLSEQFPDGIDDPVSGECKNGSTIIFTRRLLRDDSLQTYNGKISKPLDGAVSLEGSFQDEEDAKFWWSGFVINPMP